MAKSRSDAGPPGDLPAVSDRKLRLLVENSWDWVLWIDPQGRIDYSSPSCARITGHEPDRFTERPDFLPEIVHPEDRTAWSAHTCEALARKVPGETEFRIVRPDDEIRWIGHVCQPVFEDGERFLGLRVANRDITARKEAEGALATSEAHLRRAQEVANIGSWSLDVEKDTLYWSDEVYRIFGVPPGTDLDYEGFLEAVAPADRAAVNRSWRAALRGAPYDIEHRILVGDEVRWVRERAKVEFDHGGHAVRGIGIVQDITPRKVAQEEASRLREELVHVMRVTTLGEFSAAIAHELNQPLAAMLANAQAALRFLARESPDLAEVREILEDIVDDDKRARDVILGLRELTAKPVDKRKPARLAVNPLVRSVLGIVQGDLALRGVVLERSLSGDLPRARADAVQIQQALLNLILNALEAMEAAPVRRLGIRTARSVGGEIEISVADTGHGLGDADLGSLLKPFVTTKESGMGMGLAITRAIVEAHGGRLRAGGNEDGGATFVVTLPAAGAAT